MIAVEHDAAWHSEIRHEVPGVRLVEPSTAGTVGSSEAPGAYFDAYVHAVDDLADGSLDLVIVDGRARVACGMAARQKVRHGGMLLLDDSDRPRYQPLVAAMEPWPCTSYRGLRPGGGPMTQTTIWRRQ